MIFGDNAISVRTLAWMNRKMETAFILWGQKRLLRDHFGCSRAGSNPSCRLWRVSLGCCFGHVWTAVPLGGFTWLLLWSCIGMALWLKRLFRAVGSCLPLNKGEGFSLGSQLLSFSSSFSFASFVFKYPTTLTFFFFFPFENLSSLLFSRPL